MTSTDHIRYDVLAQEAMRGVLRRVMTDAARQGLPGDHHFYIAFKTDSPGVNLSDRLRQKYPEEMTVVLQHRFWELAVHNSFFEVKLTFDGIPERLSVPFTAVKVFFDPSVPYGLQFEESEAIDGAAQGGAVAQPVDGTEAPVQPALRRSLARGDRRVSGEGRGRLRRPARWHPRAMGGDQGRPRLIR